MERSGLVLVAVLLCGAAAHAGIVVGTEADLSAGGFENGLAAWSQTASDGSTPFYLAPAPEGSGQAAACALATEVSATLALVVGPNEVRGAEPGTKLEARARVWLTGAATQGELRLDLESFNGVSWTTLASSVALRASSAPRARWLRLSTLPSLTSDARLPVGSQALRFTFHNSVTGAVYFDELEVGRFGYAEYALTGGSFEGAGPYAWQSNGALDVHDGSVLADGYYGRQHLTLDAWTSTSAWQSLPAGGTSLAHAPDPGRELEASAWWRVSPTAMLGVVPNPSVFVELELVGITDGGMESLLARGRWEPTIDERGTWRYLQTEPLSALSANHSRVELRLNAALPGAVDVDFVQLGERYAVDGNPQRRVGANYVGRYRSPSFPGTTTLPSSAQDRWRNWRWVAPNACNGTFTGFHHNPDCATSAACFRENGRRDLAVSTLRGIDNLPLVGAYDSRDPDVVRYHVELAQAAGIDHFIYDWLGHKLALQNQVQGREPLNEEAFEVLRDVAEEQGRDFKVAVMYEPKVHFFGWVAGEPSYQQKLDGIVSDLVWLVEEQRERRSALRRDGRLVVFIFRDTVCSPDGSQCLDAAGWSTIAQAVTASTGEELFLIGDLAPGPGSPMSGVSRWRLVDLDMLEYRTYQDAEDARPTLPAPPLASLEQLAAEVHAVGADWVAQEDSQRVSVAVVWPGFDDTGVGGWGAPNFTGEDGAALCVRVAHDFRGAFYPTVVASALDTGVDWIHIANWNDWNEDTGLEPAWLEGYFGGPFGASVSPYKVRRHIYGRLLETQSWIADFKGITLSPRQIPRVARNYLLRAATLGQVTQYD